MTNLASVIQRVLPQTVAVIAPPTEVVDHLRKNPQLAIEPAISGSGYIYTADGYVITNNHVVAQADPNHIEVLTFDGVRHKATLVGTSPAADVAVLKIAPFSGIETITFANSDTCAFGDPVFAIGAPRALEFSVSQGIVSNPERFDRRWRHRFGDVSILPILQTDAALNPGNSGGALFNEAGEVIGMNTFIQTPMVIGGMANSPIGTALGSVGLNFALKGNAVKATADKIIKKGSSLKTGNPGFNLQAPTSLDRASMRDPIARVTHVEAGSNAAKAGLKPGDIIVAVDGNDTPHTMAAQYRLFCAAGDQATIEVRRIVKGKEEPVTLSLSFTIPETEYFTGWDDPDGSGNGMSLDQQHALIGRKDDQQS